jgi:hypothetical protein
MVEQWCRITVKLAQSQPIPIPLLVKCMVEQWCRITVKLAQSQPIPLLVKCMVEQWCRCETCPITTNTNTFIS